MEPYSISLSMGVSYYSGNSFIDKSIIKKLRDEADQKMYKDKNKKKKINK